MRTPIIFIRHGETDWNRELRFQGRRDIPLNELGRRQAERNGRAVAGFLRAGGWDLVASPLGRTIETMRLVLAAAGRADLLFATDPRLVEASYGEWEGLTLDEIEAGSPELYARREADKWAYAPPGGESYADVADRVSGCLDAISRPTLMVAHGGVLRGLMQRLAGMPSEEAGGYPVPQDRGFLFTSESVATI